MTIGPMAISITTTSTATSTSTTISTTVITTVGTTTGATAATGATALGELVGRAVGVAGAGGVPVPRPGAWQAWPLVQPLPVWLMLLPTTVLL